MLAWSCPKHPRGDVWDPSGLLVLHIPHPRLPQHGGLPTVLGEEVSGTPIWHSQAAELMQTSVYDQPSVSNLVMRVVNREEFFALWNLGGASAEGRDSGSDCLDILTYDHVCCRRCRCFCRSQKVGRAKSRGIACRGWFAWGDSAQRARMTSSAWRGIQRTGARTSRRMSLHSAITSLFLAVGLPHPHTTRFDESISQSQQKK